MRFFNKTPKPSGFTLIELLIVVAIIAILAAIAVPNFLEAQTRSKVARVKSDERTISIALESFYIDHNFYPPDGAALRPEFADVFKTRYTPWGLPDKAACDAANLSFWTINDAIFLTTPLAYMTTIPGDPFSDKDKDFKGRMFFANEKDRAQMWTITDGVDREYVISADGSQGFPTVDGRNRPFWHLESFGPDGTLNSFVDGSGKSDFVPYDPTNGTVSFGDIFRAGP